MCDVLVANTVIEVLDRMRADEEVFTAFDVTKEVRQVIANKVPHRDVRNIVKQEFSTGGLVGYNRQLCKLDTAMAPYSFVYFPNGKSATDHPLVNDVDVDDDSVDDDSVDDDSVNDDSVISATAEGRINIPKKILDQITPVGGSYDISFGGVLFPKNPNSDGRVRFYMKDLGISGNKVKITVDSDTIQVESA